MKLLILIALCFSNSFGETISFPMEKKGEILLNKIQINHRSDYSPYEQYKIDSIVGKSLPINSKIIHEVIRKNGEKVFETSFETNNLGFRVSPENLKANRFLVIAGDSNTFGEGLADNQISTYFLSQLLTGTQVINWGRRGGAPHDFLAFLSSSNWSRSIKQQTGIFVYHFIPDYMWYRIIGSKSYMVWGESAPYYELEKNQVVLKGKFQDRWITKFYQMINHNKFLNSMINELPKLSDDDLFLASKIFEQAQKKIKEKIPNAKLIVAIDNCFNDNRQDRIEIFIKQLHKLNIEAIYIDRPNKDLTIPYEGHLSTEGHKRFADEIIKNFLPII